MAKILLVKGESQIIRTSLLKRDDTPLPYTDLIDTDTRVNIYHRNILVVSYQKGTSPEIRQGATASELEFELTKTLSSNLIGLYVIEYVLKVNNIEFEIDAVQVDIFKQELEVVKNG